MFFGKTLLALSVTAALTACGGGGGGTTAPSAPVATTKTFDLKSTYANYLQSSSARTFTIIGKSSGVDVSGNGNVTIGLLQNSTFGGVAALAKTTTLSGSLSGNGTTIPYGSSAQSFYDTNYNPLGSISSVYSVVSNYTALPTAAKINDAGSLLTMTNYPSSAKPYISGTSSVSYSLSADSESSALMTLFTTEKNTAGTVTGTSTATFRVTTTNNITALGETYLSGTTSFTITYK